jgi:hypothetical protein
MLKALRIIPRTPEPTPPPDLACRVGRPTPGFERLPDHRGKLSSGELRAIISTYREDVEELADLGQAQLLALLRYHQVCRIHGSSLDNADIAKTLKTPSCGIKRGGDGGVQMGGIEKQQKQGVVDLTEDSDQACD